MIKAMGREILIEKSHSFIEKNHSFYLLFSPPTQGGKISGQKPPVIYSKLGRVDQCPCSSSSSSHGCCMYVSKSICMCSTQNPHTGFWVWGLVLDTDWFRYSTHGSSSTSSSSFDLLLLLLPSSSLLLLLIFIIIIIVISVV